MRLVTCIFFIFCVTTVALHIGVEDKIEFAIDYNTKLNPGPRMHMSHMLFNISILHNSTDVRSNVDVVGYANYTTVSKIYHSSKVQIPTYVENQPAVMDMFNDKAAWKDWMAKIGLGGNVPEVLDPKKDPDKHQYPLVLKTNLHFGRGVHIVHNPQDLRRTVAAAKAKNLTYLLEEPLTGLGLGEISVWGAAFRGRVLSMRCVRLAFTQDDVLHSAFQNGGTPLEEAAVNGSKVPFIQGFQAKPLHEQWLPCGKDLVNVTSTMLRAAEYTGPWCTAVKLDSQMRAKILEVNARFCGSQATNDGLFLAAFVPLAGAVGSAFPHAKINHALHNGTLHGVFRDMLEQEERMVLTGGGQYQGNWVTAEKFDPDLRLDHIHDSFVRIVKQHKTRHRRQE